MRDPWMRVKVKNELYISRNKSGHEQTFWDTWASYRKEVKIGPVEITSVKPLRNAQHPLSQTSVQHSCTCRYRSRKALKAAEPWTSVFCFLIPMRWVTSHLLLEWKVSIDRSEGLAVRRPVGVEFNNPGDTTVFLQFLLEEKKTPKRYILNRLNKSSTFPEWLMWCIQLTSMVLSLKYLMYSGPTYRGGLQVMTNAGEKEKKITFI